MLDLDPGTEFRRMADLYDVTELRAFNDRRPEDRTIESMGYVETYDGSGFFYDRIW